MPPRLGARLAYKAKWGGFAAAPAHPHPPFLYIFITPNGVAVLRCPAAQFFAVIRCRNMFLQRTCKCPCCPAAQFFAVEVAKAPSQPRLPPPPPAGVIGSDAWCGKSQPVQ